MRLLPDSSPLPPPPPPHKLCSSCCTPLSLLGFSPTGGAQGVWKVERTPLRFVPRAASAPHLQLFPEGKGVRWGRGGEGVPRGARATRCRGAARPAGLRACRHGWAPLELPGTAAPSGTSPWQVPSQTPSQMLSDTKPRPMAPENYVSFAHHCSHFRFLLSGFSGQDKRDDVFKAGA